VREYERIETPTDFPAMCLCGSQKAPLVDTHLVKDAYGHVYVCLQCTKRLARALGIAKGAEMDRLEHAADQLAHAEKEVSERQEIIDRMTTIAGKREEKLSALEGYIEQLTGEIALHRQQMGQVHAISSMDMAAVN